MNIAGVVDTITNAMDTAKVPATLLPPFMLKYLALCRSGLSAYKIAAKIIAGIINIGSLLILCGCSMAMVYLVARIMI